MKKFVNNHGHHAFSLEGKDYIWNKGDTLDLPENNSYIQGLIARGYIKEADKKPIKTEK
jgi:hypothetical protein